MKFKYKKAILLTAMSTMGIGILTLSISNDKTQAHEKKEVKSSMEASLLSDTQSGADNLTVTVTPSSTPIPTPTPFPVYDIEKESNAEIEKLFKDFYAAKNERKIDAIKELLDDPTKVDSQDKLEKKTQYIEEYRNIKTYAKKGFEQGTYIAYVYHEIKFTGIKTPAPGLAKFYLVTDEENNLKIFSGDLDTVTQEYYDQRNEDKDVVELIDMTNTQSQEAKKADKDLNNFWNNINELVEKNDITKAEGDSAE